MEFRVIEGTWEEVLRHGPELAGRKVRVAVLDSPATPPTMLDQALAPLIRAAEELAAEPPSVGDDAVGEVIADKFRRQGFVL
jgi:hypothetical protein